MRSAQHLWNSLNSYIWFISSIPTPVFRFRTQLMGDSRAFYSTQELTRNTRFQNHNWSGICFNLTRAPSQWQPSPKYENWFTLKVWEFHNFCSQCKCKLLRFCSHNVSPSLQNLASAPNLVIKPIKTFIFTLLILLQSLYVLSNLCILYSPFGYANLNMLPYIHKYCSFNEILSSSEWANIKFWKTLFDLI